MFTHDPTAIRCRSISVAPRSTRASPVSMPTRIATCRPRDAAHAAHASAARSARRGSSACAVGAPEREDRVTDVLLDGASLAPDQPRQLRERLVERALHPLWGNLHREGGRPYDIDEQARDHAALGAFSQAGDHGP